MAATLVGKWFQLSLTQAPALQKISSQVHTQCCPLLFRTSQQLWAEPMKRRKRIDPGIEAAREVKRIKRIDKEIRRLAKFGRILKPVDEIEMLNKKLVLGRERRRKNPVLTYEESESRALLQKEWISYRTKKWFNEYKVYDGIVAAQEEALQELREESEDLYQAALKIDYGFIPLHFQGSKLTPPIKDYLIHDGEYVDMTRKY